MKILNSIVIVDGATNMIKSKNLDWEKYEAIAKYIYETLGRESGVKIKGYGRNSKVTGKSGVNHQVDILTAHSDGIHEYQTAIECKYWVDKINKDIVMKVAEIVEDVGLSKGVIVSRNGFTQDGIDYARYKNIGLVELREIREGDLENKSPKLDIGVLDIHINVVIRRPQIHSIEIDSVEKVHIVKESWKNRNIIMMANGDKIPFANYIKSFYEELHLHSQLCETITKRYSIPGAHLINEQTKSPVPFNEITFTGLLLKIDESSTVGFTIVDRVWLIMKSFFENKTFVFSENGIISEK